MKLAVLGAGAWGTALAISFARQHEVRLWTRGSAHVEEMTVHRSNQRYLPDVLFPQHLSLSSTLHRAIADVDLIIIATPIAGLRLTLRALKSISLVLSPLLWACKGFEAGSSLLPHQVVAEELPPQHPCGVLSGPSFAREVAAGLPTAVTIGAEDAVFAEGIVREWHSPRLRLYANNDLIGVEVGGAVKNVMAIATGVADGLGLGLNTRAALMTRGLVEMTRLAVALGASPKTMTGLAGMGDLILTCTGVLSRNRQVGLRLAEGIPLPQILDELGHVAEGVTTAREVLTMAERLEVDMPITAAVCGLLYHSAVPAQVVDDLLNRSPKSEF